jgi:hypothetical protein
MTCTGWEANRIEEPSMSVNHDRNCRSYCMEVLVAADPYKSVHYVM